MCTSVVDVSSAAGVPQTQPDEIAPSGGDEFDGYS